MVVVNYEGRLLDGTVFDSNKNHGGDPATFRVGQVIKGWQDALKAMPAGSEWEIYIPQELAYGANQQGNIPPFSTLIFKVELLEVK
jgi:FKBP-type peptidyl-prolyl cis-trans isomerase FklB